MQKTKTGAKTKHPAKKGLETKNLAKNIKATKETKVVPRPDTKYLYPAGCDTLQKRKEFRRTSRQSLRKYERIMARLKKSNKAEDKKELIKQERELKQIKSAILQ